MPLKTKRIWPSPEMKWRPSVTTQFLTSDINWWLTQVINSRSLITWPQLQYNRHTKLLSHRRTWKGGPSTSLIDGMMLQLLPPIGSFRLMPRHSWYNDEAEKGCIRISECTKFGLNETNADLNSNQSTNSCPRSASSHTHWGTNLWYVP